MEQTDGAPGCTDSAGDESRVAQDGGREAVKAEEGRVVEGTVGGDREDDEYSCEEAGEAGEDADPVGEVGSET